MFGLDAQETTTVIVLLVVLLLFAGLPLALILSLFIHRWREDYRRGFARIKFHSRILLNTKVTESGGVRYTTKTYATATPKEHVLDIPAAEVWLLRGRRGLFLITTLVLAFLVVIANVLCAFGNPFTVAGVLTEIVIAVPLILVGAYLWAVRIVIKTAMYKLACREQGLALGGGPTVELTRADGNWP
jgi:hypothetical protein